MLRILLITGLFAGLLTGAPAHAGPWLRGKGDVFLSFGTEIAENGEDGFYTLYGEYGLREWVTLGFDLGGSAEDLYKAVIFARVPLRGKEGKIRLAFELGVGVKAEEPLLRPGLSIGRGFAVGDMSGWMAIDTTALIGAVRGYTEMNTDVTLGLNMSKRIKLMLQLQNGHHLTEPGYLKLAPSVVFERKPGQHFELGMLAGIKNAEDLALKLGLWQSF